MSKRGKKFDAAEKHFLEKEVKIRKEIRENNEKLEIMKKQLEEANLKCKEVTKENERLNTFVERLLEYTKLNKEDILTTCKKDVLLTEFLQSTTGLARLLKF